VTTRIKTLDLLRGIAVLGLPTMNIISFSMPLGAYLNPNVIDGSSYINHFLFSLFDIFANQKFLSLFSILFGAGIILLAEKRKTHGRSTVNAHYSRMLWLFIFGALHYWFLWFGDILMSYAIVALFAFPLYKSSSKFLLCITAISFSLCVFFSYNPTVNNLAQGSTYRSEFLEIYAPSDEQLKSMKEQRLSASYNENMRYSRESLEFDVQENSELDIEESATNNTGVDAQEELYSHVTTQLSLHYMLKIFGLMTLGMVLYRSGFLSGKRSNTEYQLLAQFGIIIGMSFTFAALFWNYSNNWSVAAFFEYGMMYSSIGSVSMTLGYIGIIVLAYRKGLFGKAAALIANVGRIALTNYLMQSLICVLIFYGFGLGLYGSLSRLGLIPVIILIWVIQIQFSKYWLNYFQQGPFEWLWRSLSTFEFQPLRKQVEDDTV
jgi:uncharacterized protein